MGRNVEELEIRTKTTGVVEVEQLDEKIKKLGKDSEQTGNKIDDMGDSTNSVTTDLKKMADEVENSTKRNNANAQSLASIAKKAVGVAVITGAFKTATSQFISFDDEIRKVGATVGANVTQMKMLRNQAKELGTMTSWSAKESAEAQFEFAKAGFSVNEILKATPSILNTAKAGQLSLAEATSITSGTLRMFKLSAEESERVGDVLAKTASSTSTDIHGLGESLKYAGIEASSMGLSLEETSAILGTLGNMKIDGSQAGTGLRRVFATLQDEAKQQKLIKVGVQLTEDGKFKNFIDILDDMKEKTKNMAQAQKETFLTDVFGAEGKLVMKALLETDEAQFDTLLSNLQQAEGYSKTVSEAFDAGLGGSFKSLKSAVEGLGISLIDNLAPVMVSVVGIVTEVSRSVAGFLEDLNEGKTYAVIFTAIIGGLTAGFVAYKTVLFLTNAITMVATVSTWALNTALAILASPVALIVAGVVALGVGFMVLYKKSETFRNAISPLINGLKVLWSWVKKFTIIGDVISGVKKLVGIGGDENTKVTGETSVTKEVNVTTVEKKGAGVNTDYLLGGNNSVSSPTGGGKSGIAGASNYTHNGFYLKGTTLKQSSSKNVYSSKEAGATSNAVPQKSLEEKILEALLAIKNLLSTNKSATNQVSVTVNKADTDEIIAQVVEDLSVALSNT